VSELTKRELVEVLGCDSDRIDVVHMGVPESFWIDHPRRTSGPLHLLFLGALSPEKDPLVALEVAGRLDNARLRFVGAGPERRRVETAVAARGLQDRVAVIGPVDDVLPHFTWADLLILTSRTEGFPGVVLEAAAAGVPSIGFDVGGVAEAVVHGETGLIVPSDGPDEMVKVLRELDRDRLVEMAERGRTRVRSEFSMQGALHRHEEAFRRVLAEDGT
jgi:glycosyltransferase involved in cell wall biosynthesis